MKPQPKNNKNIDNDSQSQEGGETLSEDVSSETLDLLEAAEAYVEKHPKNKKGKPFNKDQKLLHFLEGIDNSKAHRMCLQEDGLPVKALTFHMRKAFGARQSKAQSCVEEWADLTEYVFIHDGQVYTEQYADSMEREDPRNA